MELPAGFEPTVSELQSLALPLGYGSSEGIITPTRGKIKDEIIQSLRKTNQSSIQTVANNRVHSHKQSSYLFPDVFARLRFATCAESRIMT